MADVDDNGSYLNNGSLHIKLGGKSSPCITFAAFSLGIETTLMKFDEVTGIDVTVHTVSASNQLPYAYSIVFNVLLKNAVWSELSLWYLHNYCLLYRMVKVL
jgi:hypothetical protein